MGGEEGYSMRGLWMVAALGLLAGCEDRGGEVVGAERPGAGQQAAQGAAGAFVVDSEPNATARLLATIQATNQAEIAMAQLAIEKSQAEEVKSFARKLIDDHQRNMQELSDLAKNKKLDVQGALNSDVFLRAKQQAGNEHMEMLRAKSGRDFDAAFMSDQPADHIMLAEIAEQGQSVSNDKEVDDFFAKTHRSALEHRDHANRALPAACGGAMQGATGQNPDVMQMGGQGAQGMQMGVQGSQQGAPMGGSDQGAPGVQRGTAPSIRGSMGAPGQTGGQGQGNQGQGQGTQH